MCTCWKWESAGSRLSPAGSLVESLPTDPLKPARAVSAGRADLEEPAEGSTAEPGVDGKFEPAEGKPRPVESDSLPGSQLAADDVFGQPEIRPCAAVPQDSIASKRPRNGLWGAFAAAFRNLLRGGAAPTPDRNLPGDVAAPPGSSRVSETLPVEQRLAGVLPSPQNDETASETDSLLEELSNPSPPPQEKLPEAKFYAIEALKAEPLPATDFSAQAESPADTNRKLGPAETRAEGFHHGSTTPVRPSMHRRVLAAG